MGEEFEKIKATLELYQTTEDKVAFLLRQVEWLLQVKDAYAENLAGIQGVLSALD